MKKALLLLLLSASAVLAEEKLAFVFELVRHGARAPIDKTYFKDFLVPPGHLTAQGMR